MERVRQEVDLDTVVDGVQVLMRLGKRAEQQDAAYIGPGVVAVADGMGGHDDGAAASRAALEAFATAVHQGDGIADAAVRADGAVRALSGPRWSPHAPGTTLVAARHETGRLDGVWSGDSRAYGLRTDGRLELLTEDHSGFMGAIEHALGAFSPDPFHLDRFCCDAADTVGLLLCSDGLTRPFDAALFGDGMIGDVDVADDDAAATLATVLADRGIEGLVELAAQVGSDNITAVWWPL